jgi:hypothetical protein
MEGLPGNLTLTAVPLVFFSCLKVASPLWTHEDFEEVMHYTICIADSAALKCARMLENRRALYLAIQFARTHPDRRGTMHAVQQLTMSAQHGSVYPADT